MSKSLEVVQQESEEAKKYLPSLEREKYKRPVIERITKPSEAIRYVSDSHRAKQTIPEEAIKYQRA